MQHWSLSWKLQPGDTPMTDVSPTSSYSPLCKIQFPEKSKLAQTCILKTEALKEFLCPERREKSQRLKKKISFTLCNHFYLLPKALYSDAHTLRGLSGRWCQKKRFGCTREPRMGR